MGALGKSQRETQGADTEVSEFEALLAEVGLALPRHWFHL